MPGELRDATGIIGVAGLNGGDVTTAEFVALESRVDTLEANTPPDVLNDLSDVSGTPATGDLLQYDGSGWVPYTPETSTVTIGMSTILGGTGTPVPVALYYGMYVPHAATITGWALGADVSSTTTIGVWIDTHANYPPVLADEKFTMTLTAQSKNTGTLGTAIPVAAGSWVFYNVGANNNATVLMPNIIATREV